MRTRPWKIAKVGIRNTRGERVEAEVVLNEQADGSLGWTTKFWIPLTGGTFDRFGIRAKNGNWVWFGMRAQTFSAAPLRERMWYARIGRSGESKHSLTLTATIPTDIYDVLHTIDVDHAES